jgi:hypothetical protein
LLLLVWTSLTLAACGGAPTPDVEETVQAGVAATLTAQPTETPTATATATAAPKLTATATKDRTRRQPQGHTRDTVPHRR